MFGRKEKPDRAAQSAASTAEAERLAALSAREFGAMLMPAFAEGGARKKGDSVQTMQLLQWLRATNPAEPDLRPLITPAQAALQALENAGLLVHTISGTGSGVRRYKLTPVGSAALRDGAYREMLGVSSG